MINIRNYLFRINQIEIQNINTPLVLKYFKNEKDLYDLLDARYEDIKYDDDKILKTIILLFKNNFNVNYKYENNTYLDVVLHGYKLHSPSEKIKIVKYSDYFILNIIKILLQFNFKFKSDNGTPLFLSILEKEKRDALKEKIIKELNLLYKPNENKIDLENKTIDKDPVIEKPQIDYKRLKEIQELKKEIIVETKKDLEIAIKKEQEESYKENISSDNNLPKEELEKEPENNLSSKKIDFQSNEPVLKKDIENQYFTDLPIIPSVKPIEEPKKLKEPTIEEKIKEFKPPIEEYNIDKEILNSSEENIEKNTKNNNLSENQDEELRNETEDLLQKEIESFEEEIISEIVSKDGNPLEKIPQEEQLIKNDIKDESKIKDSEKIIFKKDDEWKYLCDLIQDSNVYNDLIKYLNLIKEEEVTKALKEIKERENMILIYTEYYKDNILHNISLNHIDKMAKMLSKTKKKYIKVPFEKEFDKIKLDYLKKLSYIKTFAKNANNLVQLKESLNMLIKFNDEEATKKIKREVEYKILEMESAIRKDKQYIKEINNIAKILNLYNIPLSTDPSLINNYETIKQLKLEELSQKELDKITLIIEDIKTESLETIYSHLGNNIDRALEVLAILVSAKFINLMSAQNVFGQLVSTYGTVKQKLIHAMPILSLTKKIHLN